MPRYEPPKITSRSFFDRVASFPGLVQLSDPEPNWYRFAHGYRLAADKLAATVNQRGATADYVCLPMLFLYRHSVELYLKALLIDIGDLLDEAEVTSGNHCLEPLWARFKDRLLEYDWSQDSPWLTRAGELIAELDRIDGQSFSFRYPVAKDGTRLLARDDTVNIRHFADVMKELALVLEGAAALLDEHLNLKHEMENDSYYDYYQ